MLSRSFDSSDEAPKRVSDDESLTEESLVVLDATRSREYDEASSDVDEGVASSSVKKSNSSDSTEFEASSETSAAEVNTGLFEMNLSNEEQMLERHIRMLERFHRLLADMIQIQNELEQQTRLRLAAVRLSNHRGVSAVGSMSMFAAPPAQSDSTSESEPSLSKRPS